MEPQATPHDAPMDTGPPPGFGGRRRIRRIKLKLPAKTQQKMVAAWLADRPVTCAIVGAADLASGTKAETRQLYTAWKRADGSVRMSFPFFERVFHTLLDQSGDKSVGQSTGQVIGPGTGPGPGGAYWRPGRDPWAYTDVSPSWLGIA